MIKKPKEFDPFEFVKAERDWTKRFSLLLKKHLPPKELAQKLEALHSERPIIPKSHKKFEVLLSPGVWSQASIMEVLTEEGIWFQFDFAVHPNSIGVLVSKEQADSAERLLYGFGGPSIRIEVQPEFRGLSKKKEIASVLKKHGIQFEWEEDGRGKPVSIRVRTRQAQELEKRLRSWLAVSQKKNVT